MWNLRYDTNELNCETETDPQTQRTDLWLPRVGLDWEFGTSGCKLVYIEWINNKDLPYSVGNYIQYPVINHNGKEHEKLYIYMYKTESLCCTPEINTTL